MRAQQSPAAPFEIRVALLLIYALLVARVAAILLVLSSPARGELPGLRSGLPPISIPLVIVFVIVTRRSIRRGRRWARNAYVVYAFARIALIAALGRFDSLSISFVLGYLLIAVLLLSPAANEWLNRVGG